VTGMLSTRDSLGLIYNFVVVGKAVGVFREMVPNACSNHFVQ